MRVKAALENPVDCDLDPRSERTDTRGMRLETEIVEEQVEKGEKECPSGQTSS